MAKFYEEYTIYLGDKVSFEVHDFERNCTMIQTGTVQDISQLPDVFVEGFDVIRNGKYNRWKIGINSLRLIYSEHEDAGISWRTEIDEDEEVEFVHKGDPGTREFNEIEYIDHKKH